jgi:hypothetical protein
MLVDLRGAVLCRRSDDDEPYEVMNETGKKWWYEVDELVKTSGKPKKGKDTKPKKRVAVAAQRVVAVERLAMAEQRLAMAEQRLTMMTEQRVTAAELLQRERREPSSLDVGQAEAVRPSLGVSPLRDPVGPSGDFDGSDDELDVPLRCLVKRKPISLSVQEPRAKKQALKRGETAVVDRKRVPDPVPEHTTAATKTKSTQLAHPTAAASEKQKQQQKQTQKLKRRAPTTSKHQVTKLPRQPLTSPAASFKSFTPVHRDRAGETLVKCFMHGQGSGGTCPSGSCHNTSLRRPCYLKEEVLAARPGLRDGMRATCCDVCCHLLAPCEVKLSEDGSVVSCSSGGGRVIAGNAMQDGRHYVEMAWTNGSRAKTVKKLAQFGVQTIDGSMSWLFSHEELDPMRKDRTNMRKAKPRDNVGMLLDLEERSLAIYINGQRIGYVLRPGSLSYAGQSYQWVAGCFSSCNEKEYGLEAQIEISNRVVPVLSASDEAAEAAATAEVARIAAARKENKKRRKAEDEKRAAVTQAECAMFRALHHSRGCICAARWDGCSFGGHDFAARKAGLLDR